MIFTCLVVVMGWTGNGAAHRRDGLSSIFPVSPPAAPPQAPEKEDTSGPLALRPDSYWKRLIAQEQAGDYQEAFKTGLALVNLFPQAPQRGAALLKLAEMAKGQGKTAEASELFGLVSSITPGTLEASQACLAADSLELSRELHQGNPVQALRHFLKKVSGLPAGYSPESLQEALRTGWQAVAHAVQAAAPLPLPLVEEILALWDLQPQGIGPPEAAHLLADLLKKNGLVEAAQTLLAKAGDNTKGNQPKMLKAFGLEHPWLAGTSPGSREALCLVSKGAEEQKFFLPSRLPRWQTGVEPSATPGEALVTWFLPQTANAAWQEGQVPALGPSLLYSRPAPFPERPPTGLGRNSSPAGNSSPPAQTGQSAPDKPMRGDEGPFYQDRLGLSHLQGGQSDAAQATFQDLAQHHDPFWQRLARVRLADLELSRLQAEPTP